MRSSRILQGESLLCLAVCLVDQDPERRSLPCLALLRTIIIPFFQTSDQARFLRLFKNLLSRENSDLNEDKILMVRLLTSLAQLRGGRQGGGVVEARNLPTPSQAGREAEKNKHGHEQNAIHDHWSSSQHSHQHTEVNTTTLRGER